MKSNKEQTLECIKNIMEKYFYRTLGIKRIKNKLVTTELVMHDLKTIYELVKDIEEKQ